VIAALLPISALGMDCIKAGLFRNNKPHHFAPTVYHIIPIMSMGFGKIIPKILAFNFAL
jgi:hypothetical protein